MNGTNYSTKSIHWASLTAEDLTMPHKSFHIPLRTSSMKPNSSDGSNRKEHKSRSIPKAQRILGTTGIAVDKDYHKRPDQKTSRSANYLNAPEAQQNPDADEDGRQPPNLRVRASSPLLGQNYRDTRSPKPSLVQLSRKLHLSPSSSGLYSRYSSKDASAEPSTDHGQDHGENMEDQEIPDNGFNPAFKQPKGPMKDSKRKARPPRIDLSLLFPRPQNNSTPLLSPQRMVSSPSALSMTSEYSTLKPHNSESRLGKKLTKSPRPRASSRPEETQQTLNGILNSSLLQDTPPVWSNPSLEKTVRTSEMDWALQKDLDAQPTPRSTERALYSQMNSSLRARPQTQHSDSRSYLSAGESAHSSQRTLRKATSARSLNKGPSVSKKSSKSTLKNTDLNKSSVLCLSSSEDEDDEPQPLLKPPFRPSRNKRDSVSTYGGYDAEICTAAAAQATRGTLRSVERPSSSQTQSSRSSSKYLQPQQDSNASIPRKSSLTAGGNQSRRSSGVPAILEPGFLHSDPIFEDKSHVRTRTPTMSQREMNRRSRVMTVTRQEERLLEVMRLRHGKMTPSIFNEHVEPDRRSVVSGLSVPSRDSFYCSDTSFLRLSPGIPPSVPAPPLPPSYYQNKAASTQQGTGSDTEDKTTTSVPSPQASVSSKSLPSPATSATSPLTPTLPIHRFSPLPSQKPPPQRPPPPVPEVQRNHSRRRTDSSGAIALEDPAEDPSEGSEFPPWALGWTTEGSHLTAVH